MFAPGTGTEHRRTAVGNTAVPPYQGDQARLELRCDAVERILVMTLYATGARRAEIAALKVSDIDSQKIVVTSTAAREQGPGRDIEAGAAVTLCTYWRGLRHKPAM